MEWMSRRMPERLDPRIVLDGAETMIALALAYHRRAAEQAAIVLMFVDRAVDAYDPPHDRRCGDCTLCLRACPTRPQPEGDPRFSPRPMAALAPADVASLSPDEFQRLTAGMALARAQYDGLRRNALYAIGSARDGSARSILERLARDPSEAVRDAARWALDRLDRAAEADG